MGLLDPLSSAIAKLTALPTTPLPGSVIVQPTQVTQPSTSISAPSQQTQGMIIYPTINTIINPVAPSLSPVAATPLQIVSPTYPTIAGLTPITTIPKPVTPNLSPIIAGYTPPNLSTLGYAVGRSESITPQQVSILRSSLGSPDITKMFTYPLFERMTKATEWTIEKIRGASGFVEAPKIAKPFIQPFQTFGTGVITGIASIPSLVTTAALGGEIIARQPVKALTVALPVGLGLTAGSMITSFKERPLETTGEFIGQSLAFGKVGAGLKTLTESIKYSAKEYIPKSKIIESQILTGKEQFPVAQKGILSPEKLIQEFKISEYKPPGTEFKLGGWHATPEEFAAGTRVQAGTSSVPGLHIAPSLSPYFLKIVTGEITSLFGWGTTPAKPAALWIGVKQLSRIPEQFRGAGATSYLIKEAPKGEAFITPKFETLIKIAKAEKEAVVTPETMLKRIGSKYYTEIEGKRIPIYEYEAFTESQVSPTPLSGFINKLTGKQTAGELFKKQSLAYESYRNPRNVIITPYKVAKLMYGASILNRNYIPKPFNTEKKTPVYPISKLTIPMHLTPKTPVKTPSYPVSKTPIRTPVYPISKLTIPMHITSKTPVKTPSYPVSKTPIRTPVYPISKLTIPMHITSKTPVKTPSYKTPPDLISKSITPSYKTPKTPVKTPSYPKSIPEPTEILKPEFKSKPDIPSIFKKKRKGTKSFFKFGEGAKIATATEMFKGKSFSTPSKDTKTALNKLFKRKP